MAKKRDLYAVNGQAVQGVTTIIGCLDKPALVGWAAKEASLFVGAHWEAGKSYSAEYIAAVLHNCKSAHRVKKEKAGDIGTDIHALVEAYCGQQILPDDVPDTAGEPEPGYKRKALQNFAKVTAGWIWLGAEIVVIYSPPDGEDGKPDMNLAYGGTADGLAMLPNGMIVLTDTKTSSGVYATHDLQCAMYALAMPQHDMPIIVSGRHAGDPGIKTTLHALWRKIAEARILHFDKELCTWEVLERDVKKHIPYIHGICEAAAWKKKYDKPVWENAGVPAVIPEAYLEKSVPATSIHIA